MTVHNAIHTTIGRTPLVRLNRTGGDLKAEIDAKLEFFNPLGSVKDRIAAAMIDDAEKKGLHRARHPDRGTHQRQHRHRAGLYLRGPGIPALPDHAGNHERRAPETAASPGSGLVLTPGPPEAWAGPSKKPIAIVSENPGAFMPNQFENPANPRIHRETTAEEIWADTGGEVDILVSGVGTGGTTHRGGRIFSRRRSPAFSVVAVEPTDSPILSGGEKGPHKIQGIGAGFVPRVLDRSLIDEVVTVSNDDAFETARGLAAGKGSCAASPRGRQCGPLFRSPPDQKMPASASSLFCPVRVSATSAPNCSNNSHFRMATC
jgi:cysteine synthase A